MTFQMLYSRALQILDMTLGLLIGLAVLVFFWGIIQYVISQGDSKKLEEGRKVMLYGIIGLAAMVSVWGIVNLLVFTVFGTTAGDPFSFDIPLLQTSGGSDTTTSNTLDNSNLSQQVSPDQTQSCQPGYVWNSLFGTCTLPPNTVPADTTPQPNQTPAQEAPISCAPGTTYNFSTERCE